MALKEGDELEIKSAAFMQAKGYYVKRGVNISVGGDTSDVTDIDVLSIIYNSTLNEERVIIDCKDKSSPQAFERILWLVGLKQYAKADRAIFVAPRVVWQAKDFAVQGKVEILESKTIDHVLGGRIADYGYGAASLSLEIELDNCWKSVSRSGREMKRAYAGLKNTAIYGHPITNINRIIHFVKQVYHTEVSSTDLAWLKRYICFEGASLFSLMIAHFGSEIKWLQTSDWSGYLGKRLTYGDMDPKTASRIISILDKDNAEPIPPPEYSNSIKQIVENTLRDENIGKIANWTDLYLFGHSLIISGDGLREDPLYRSNFQEIESLAMRFPPRSVQSGCKERVPLKGSHELVQVRMEAPTGGGPNQTALRTLLEQDFLALSAV